VAGIFIICLCGDLSAMGGPSESLLATIACSTVDLKYSSCGEALNNSAAFIGEWERNDNGPSNVRIRRASTKQEASYLLFELLAGLGSMLPLLNAASQCPEKARLFTAPSESMGASWEPF